MNITAAREQLHEIFKQNPQNSVFHFSEQDQNNMRSPQKNICRHEDIMKSAPPSRQIYNQFMKEQCQKIITQKTINQEKVEVKIPLFKSTRRNNFFSSQKERFSKLGLQGFLNEEIPQPKSLIKNAEHEEQKIIKNLNNTYFRTTEHINAKRKSLMNTLGIKKTSMSSYKVDWNGTNYEKIQFQWKQIQYIPNKIFPCRKGSNTKNRIFTPKNKESDLYCSTAKKKNEEVSLQLNKIKKTMSVNMLQNKQIDGNHSYLTQKSLSPKKSPNDSDTEKLYSINSMVFKNPKKLIKKNYVGPVLKDQEMLQPKSQNRKRPFTSKESHRSRSGQMDKIQHKNERSLFESQKQNQRLFLHFARPQKPSKSPIRAAKDYELNTGVVVGRKITLRK